jgi:hypothetical protein
MTILYVAVDVYPFNVMQPFTQSMVRILYMSEWNNKFRLLNYEFE